jgi:hypothetical protein
MGKFQVGILGGFEGKVGTVVGGRWKGIDYMRHKGRKSTKPPTQAQLEQQAKFTLVTKFIHKFSLLLMRSFKETPQLTGTNVAFTYNYNKAIAGAYPNYSLDFSKVALSIGELQNAVLPTASDAGGGKIKYDWQDNSGDTLAAADDIAILVAYCEETNQSIFTMAGAARNVKTDTLNVGNFTGKTVQTWISFVSKDGKEYATSIYTGEVIVS